MHILIIKNYDKRILLLMMMKKKLHRYFLS